MHRFILALLILFLCAGCYPVDAPIAPVATAPIAQPPAPMPKTFDLTIVHTNDTWGYLLPCG